MPPSQLIIHDCQTVPESAEGHTSSDSPKLVEIKHPSYPDITNILIAFTAYDSLDGGIHHETARIACGILCGNRWDGYLTETSDGPPLAISSAGVLPAGVYYFQVPPPPRNTPGTDQPWVYPVVPSFAHWRFPHSNLPGLWVPPPPSPSSSSSQLHLPIRSDVTLAATLRDRSCRISSRLEGCNAAHIVPRNEQQWFLMNGMMRYALKKNGNQFHDLRNVLILRSDLHFAFDQQKFAIVPKATDDVQDSPKWVVHLLCNSYELSLLYHNVKLQPTTVSPEFLFARFAWSLFPLLAAFLSSLQQRKLLTVYSTNLEQQEMECLPSDYDFSTIPPQANPQRPKKKSRTSNNEEAADSFEKSPCISASTLSNESKSSPAKLAPYSAFPLSEEELDDCRLDFLKERYLEVERARSDPEGHWPKDQRWLELAHDRPLSPDGMQRYLEITGVEFLDARE